MTRMAFIRKWLGMPYNDTNKMAMLDDLDKIEFQDGLYVPPEPMRYSTEYNAAHTLQTVVEYELFKKALELLRVAYNLRDIGMTNRRKKEIRDFLSKYER